MVVCGYCNSLYFVMYSVSLKIYILNCVDFLSVWFLLPTNGNVFRPMSPKPGPSGTKKKRGAGEMAGGEEKKKRGRKKKKIEEDFDSDSDSSISEGTLLKIEIYNSGITLSKNNVSEHF